MARIAKSDVVDALKLVASSIKSAGGANGRVSRADLRRALSDGRVPLEQRGLVDLFFRFVDRESDARLRGQVTSSDLDRAVECARTDLVKKYDLNHNGLSKDEALQMNAVGRGAFALARALKAAARHTGW